ncbi:MAG: lysoplasmalogenase [Candidatus Lokiarchaeota archaeon]|nr:lysoplasmalogenase [Candidatus Lokiarchaeota archaeon]
MNWIQILILVIFGIDAVLHLLSEYQKIKGKSGVIMEYLTKPLLMPLLAAFYVVSALANAISINWWFVVGILGGFLGDFFLLIDQKRNKLMFKLGLIAFLFGHIFYFIAFFIRGWDFAAFQWWSLIIGALFVVYGVILAPILLKHTGKMSLPVGIYLVIIVLMGVSASALIGIISTMGIVFLIIGAWLFIISDTFNAIGRFVKPIRYERIYTMFTYILGQLFIVLGFTFA